MLSWLPLIFLLCNLNNGRERLGFLPLSFVFTTSMRASFYSFGTEKRCYSAAWVLQLILIAVVVYEIKENTYA